MLVVASVTGGPLDLRMEGAGRAGALQDVPGGVRRGSQLWSGLGKLCSGGGASLWQGMLGQMPPLHSCHRPLWPPGKRIQ